jgi:hypothetical protein
MDRMAMDNSNLSILTDIFERSGLNNTMIDSAYDVTSRLDFDPDTNPDGYRFETPSDAPQDVIVLANSLKAARTDIIDIDEIQIRSPGLSEQILYLNDDDAAMIVVLGGGVDIILTIADAGPNYDVSKIINVTETRVLHLGPRDNTNSFYSQITLRNTNQHTVGRPIVIVIYCDELAPLFPPSQPVMSEWTVITDVMSPQLLEHIRSVFPLSTIRNFKFNKSGAIQALHAWANKELGLTFKFTDLITISHLEHDHNSTLRLRDVPNALIFAVHGTVIAGNHELSPGLALLVEGTSNIDVWTKSAGVPDNGVDIIPKYIVLRNA